MVGCQGSVEYFGQGPDRHSICLSARAIRAVRGALEELKALTSRGNSPNLRVEAFAKSFSEAIKSNKTTPVPVTEIPRTALEVILGLGEPSLPDCHELSERTCVVPLFVRTLSRSYHAVLAMLASRVRGTTGRNALVGTGARAPPLSSSRQPSTTAITAYKGAGSCSAVACHGSISSVAGSSVLRNEHTTWISDDRHSRAFQVLFDERSQRIAYNLAAGKDPVPAAEDTRCLACHTTPRPESLLRATKWMNQDGVGCESCHGSSEKWLGLHTTDKWKGISPREKQDNYGFTYTKNVVHRVELCASCHVGQDARDGFPLRDVNHDLIAAGHPRLNFEFAAYQENQPKHWNDNKPAAAEAAADFPARAWALGQLVSAKAALELVGVSCSRQTASRVASRLAGRQVAYSLARIRRVRLFFVPSQPGRRALATEPGNIWRTTWRAGVGLLVVLTHLRPAREFQCRRSRQGHRIPGSTQGTHRGDEPPDSRYGHGQADSRQWNKGS